MSIASKLDSKRRRVREKVSKLGLRFIAVVEALKLDILR